MRSIDKRSDSDLRSLRETKMRRRGDTDLGPSSPWFGLAMCLLPLLLVSSWLPSLVAGMELTFELPDNAEQCFHEVVNKSVKCTLEFQVVTGGQYDVDIHIEAPNGHILYKDVKKQYDSFTWTTDQTGVYTVCFSNEFSTFSHKLVYMDLQIGEQDELRIPKEVTAMTQMETSISAIHEDLVTVLDYQTHHRLREAQGRKRAEHLNERVFYWSLGETIIILSVCVGQVFILKNFFSEKRYALLDNSSH